MLKYCTQYERKNSAVATGLEMVSFHSKPNEGHCQRMFKLLHSFHMLARLWSKSFKLSFNSMWTENFQMFKLDLEKAEEQEIKLPSSAGSLIKQESSRKTSTSISLTMLKSLCGSQQTVENSSRDGNTRPPDLPPEKSVCRSKSHS